MSTVPTLLDRRDSPPSFLNGQERIGMILLIALAAVSITALSIVLLCHRRNIHQQTQATPLSVRRLYKDVDSTNKPIIHDLYIGQILDTYKTSWEVFMPVSLMPTLVPHSQSPKPAPLRAATADHHSHLLATLLITMPRSPNHMNISQEQLHDLHIGVATVELNHPLRPSGT
ncbi:hypothetical protein BDY19DRAFT_998031 [Irpex rosettiformis]|uniref:Uncharacterized protein n=1 Tax=Irpex rosettiformis TaxID=378272 RepID=A0ACB8TQ08_9APHY|nr:hypothetical protein BDY19DRAFT_998031 [Irpex rosettiformis]